jgi:hypothetical protein
MGVTCEEKMRLIEEYTHAPAELTNALKELHLRSVSGKAEKGGLQRIVAKREVELEQARRAFEKHTAEHGC